VKSESLFKKCYHSFPREKRKKCRGASSPRTEKNQNSIRVQKEDNRCLNVGHLGRGAGRGCLQNRLLSWGVGAGKKNGGGCSGPKGGVPISHVGRGEKKKSSEKK